MERELFGPCLTVYPYPEARYSETLELCDGTSPYALTGSIFADDRAAIALAHEKLRHAAGNFYVNDKPTGVGRRPAALRRRPRVGHERQGGLVEQPHALVVAASRQGDVRAAAEHRLPAHGARLARVTEPAEETTAPGVLVAVCRERADGERRVALTPDEVKRLGESGARVRLERGAGVAAGYPDESYALPAPSSSPTPPPRSQAPTSSLRVAPPADDEIAALPADALLISYLRPLDRPES